MYNKYPNRSSHKPKKWDLDRQPKMKKVVRKDGTHDLVKEKSKKR